MKKWLLLLVIGCLFAGMIPIVYGEMRSPVKVGCFTGDSVAMREERVALLARFFLPDIHAGDVMEENVRQRMQWVDSTGGQSVDGEGRRGRIAGMLEFICPPDKFFSGRMGEMTDSVRVVELLYLTFAEFVTGNDEKAVEGCEELLDVFKGGGERMASVCAALQVVKAEALMGLGCREDAIKNLEEAVAVFKGLGIVCYNDYLQALYSLGCAYARNGEYEMGAKCFSSILSFYYRTNIELDEYYLSLVSYMELYYRKYGSEHDRWAFRGCMAFRWVKCAVSPKEEVASMTEEVGDIQNWVDTFRDKRVLPYKAFEYGGGQEETVEDRLWKLDLLLAQRREMKALVENITPIDSVGLKARENEWCGYGYDRQALWDGLRCFENIVEYLKNGEYEKAVDLYERETESVYALLRFDCESGRMMAFNYAICKACISLDDVSRKLKGIEFALESSNGLLEYLMEIKDERPDSLEISGFYVFNLHELSLVNDVAGDWDGMLAYVDEELAELERRGEKMTESYADILYNKVVAYEKQKRWGKVIDAMGEWLDIYKNIGMKNSDDYLVGLFYTGCAHLFNEEYDECAKYYAELLDCYLHMELRRDDCYFFLISYLGMYYHEYGSKNEERKFYKKLAKVGNEKVSAIKKDMEGIYEISVLQVLADGFTRDNKMRDYFPSGEK